MLLSRPNFLTWAFPKLLDNTLRGIVAEYIVATALNLTDQPREEWAPYDLTAPNGLRIEVKSSAYLQSWAQSKPSAIRFGIARTRAWNVNTGLYDQEVKRQSDVYVFCVFTERDPAKPNPLDTEKWEFYIVPTQLMNERLGAQKTIGLASLKLLAGNAVRFAALAQAVQAMHQPS